MRSKQSRFSDVRIHTKGRSIDDFSLMNEFWYLTNAFCKESNNLKIYCLNLKCITPENKFRLLQYRIETAICISEIMKKAKICETMLGSKQIK